ncbi:cyclase family protein [Mycobacterium sp. 21AC1]|uniref:cyclase family protein n=1 Tax=[Mycobacterium] appelbergii TaxID=2939269 RepID=UPI00293942E0|nr:cyclase family protein [Mycobacterium sp. 21AC1]MDV3123476.1 cyclase family protein [Mycobacterium sp. 21AC1]
MRLLDHLAEHPIRIVDLSQPLFNGAPSSPSHPGFRSALTLRHGDAVREDGMTGAHELFTSGGHVGTHVDALCHVAVDGRIFGGRPAEVVDGHYAAGGIDEFPLAVRRAVLVDVPALRGVGRLAPAEPVTADDLDMVGVPIGPGDAVLVRTGWAQLWPDSNAYLGRETGVPGLDPSGAAWLADRQVAIVGADTLAVEKISVAVGHSRLPVHRILLAEHGINLIEVMNLEPVRGQTEFAFVCAPLNILGATGAPVRPLALLDLTSKGGQQ